METIFRSLASDIGIALGYTILHSLWQSAILLGIVLVVNRLDIKSSQKYNINLSALLAQVLISLGTFKFIYHSITLADQSAFNTINFTNQLKLAVGTTEQMSLVVRLWVWCQTHIHILVGLWLVGMVCQLIRLILNYYQIQLLKNSRHLPVAKEVADLLTQLRFKFWITKKIQIFESTKITNPIVIGHIKPIILLPVALCSHLSVAELEAILAHELAHIKRNDFLQNLAQSFFETVYFFNPAFLFISKMAKAERELACDQMATEQGVGQIHLAKALLQVAQYKQEFSLGMAFGRKTNSFSNRIKSLLGMPQEQNNFSKNILLLLLLVGTTIWYVKAQQKDPTKQTSTQKTTQSTTTIHSALADSMVTRHYINNNNKSLTIEQNGGKVIVNGKVYHMSEQDSLKMMELHQKYKAIENEMNNHSKDIEVLAQQIDDKAKDFHHDNGLEIANQKKIEAASKEIEAASKALEAVSHKMEIYQIEADKRNGGKQLNAQEWEKYNKDYEKQMAKYQEKIDKYEKEIEKYEEGMNEYELKANAFEKEVEVIEMAMEKHEVPMEKLSGELEKLSTEMMALYPLEAKKAVKAIGVVLDELPRPARAPKAPRHLRSMPKPPTPPLPPAAPSASSHITLPSSPLPPAAPSAPSHIAVPSPPAQATLPAAPTPPIAPKSPRVPR